MKVVKAVPSPGRNTHPILTSNQNPQQHHDDAAMPDGEHAQEALDLPNDTAILDSLSPTLSLLRESK
jgi:hypothetical protein